jgi:type I restriction enzyme S subunit
MKPGYKQTEVGVIPEDWEVPYLRRHLLQDATYGVVKAGAFQRSGIPMLRSGEIKNALIIEDHPLITPEKSQEYSRTILKRNDVVIALVGYPGETAVIPDRLIGANISRAVGLLRPASSLTPEFLACYLNSPNGRKEFLRPSVGSAQIVVNLGALNKLRLPVPSLPEQRAIAEALSDVDGLLGGLDRLIAKKRDLKQAAMQQLLTGQTRLPGFHGEWEVKRLGDIAEMGSGGTPSSSIADYYDGDIPWVSIADMTKCGKIIMTTDRNLTRAGFSSCAAKMFPAGTVLYAMYASLGECSVAGISVCSSQAILGIRTRSGLSNEFLYYYLTSLKPVVKSLGQQGTQANLNKAMVQDFCFSLPPLPEQTAIATVLSDMDAELTALEERREKTLALKQAMMQELLTGKTRLV